MGVTCRQVRDRRPMARAARSDGRLTALLLRLDGPRDPVLPRRQVLDAIGRAGLERAVADGMLTTVLPGWYGLTAHAEDHQVRCAAVVRWSRGALVITGRSALHLCSTAGSPHLSGSRLAARGTATSARRPGCASRTANPFGGGSRWQESRAW